MNIGGVDGVNTVGVTAAMNEMTIAHGGQQLLQMAPAATAQGSDSVVFFFFAQLTAAQMEVVATRWHSFVFMAQGWLLVICGSGVFFFFSTFGGGSNGGGIDAGCFFVRGTAATNDGYLIFALDSRNNGDECEGVL